MRLTLPLAFVLFTALLPSARGGADSKRWINSAACAEQCEQIQSCATKAHRADQGRVLCHIAACESGKFCGKKEVRSPNGLYHGPFQFGRPTWKSVCQPLFKKTGITTCSGKRSIYDTCCTSMCAAEVIGAELNNGIKNWPRCGPAAERAVASENNSKN